MNRKYGIGIVGAGMASKPHVKSLQDLADRVVVRGVYVRSQDARETFAAQTGFPAASSYEALLADDKLDAILMLTPPNARVELTRKAAAAGKHILMEKPVERSTAVAKEIVDICDKAGITLGVIFQHRFRESSLALRKIIESGTLGKLQSVALNVPWWRSHEYYQEPGRGTLERDGGGVLITQAIHVIDLMLSLTGPVAQVQAMAGAAMHDIETEDFVGGGMLFENGALGSISATVNSFPGDQEYLLMNYENATVRLAGSTLEVRWLDGRIETAGETQNTGGGADPMDFPFIWHKANIVDFVDAVEVNRAPLSNGHTALHVHRLIDALISSAKEGRRISV